MNKYLAALAAVGLSGSLALVSGAACAGVVMTETTTVGGAQPGRSQERTVMIEGNKEKTVTGNREMIIDLDKGTMDFVNPAQKSYFERPFPPEGMAGQKGAPASPQSDFTKTGKTRTIAGYPCEDYSGTGKYPMGEVSTVSCVSKKAPGAADFAKFQETMMAKLKGTRLAMPANMPDGVPLAQENTARMNTITLPPNLPPDTAAKMKEQLANRPPVVSKTEVTKIESREIAASEFEIPAGFTKAAAPNPMMMHPGMSGMGMGMPPKAGSAAGASAPMMMKPATGGTGAAQNAGSGAGAPPAPASKP